MNYRIFICYDGARYKGWQRLKNTDNTVQGKLENTISRLLKQPIEIIGASRTDAGVHAKNQIANFKTDQILDELDFCNQLNKYLPEDISIIKIEVASDDYHARFHSNKKAYQYRIWKASYPPVFEREYVLKYEGSPLNIELIKKASELLLGTHDFKGFCTDKTKKSTVRNIYNIEVIETSEEIQILVEGDGFLYNMVRIIVGTLIEVGAGKRTPESIKRILETGDRSIAGETAPAKGLTLFKIYSEK